MVIWVASFPHSEHRMTLRTLTDLYGVNRVGSLGRPGIFRPPRRNPYEVPEELKDLDNDEWMEALRARPETFFVETHAHQQSADPSPALYTVRDGRDVHVSMAHRIAAKNIPSYNEQSFAQRLETLVAGRSWSRHVHAWRTRDAPTAVVRFEDLLEDPAGAIAGPPRSSATRCRTRWGIRRL